MQSFSRNNDFLPDAARRIFQDAKKSPCNLPMNYSFTNEIINLTLVWLNSSGYFEGMEASWKPGKKCHGMAW